MAEIFVAKASEFADGERRIVAQNGIEISSAGRDIAGLFDILYKPAR